ncbi:DctP family TRAP transporter solute-binding subunit [Cytobacillus sp. Hz8]|uniref:DctP family TRAP transporter solute-binding subunit n=1 Tax=Cytobacillus sp. Hz8 TaxID=3347168 RepID=UPI0035D7ABEF
MKYLIGTSLLVIFIILYILFHPLDFLSGKELPFDDEQEGLSNQIVIRFSHVVAENTPKGLAAQKFAQLVEQKTNGLVKVEVFPNARLYTDDEELKALRNNDVQMIAPSLSKMTKLNSDWGLFDLPFLFQNKEDIASFLSSKAGKKFLTLHEDEGIKGLALWSNGFKQMTSNVNPVQHPEDFVGQRFRIMPSDIIAEQFQALGASPIEVPFDQLYSALQEDQFDGQENTISNIYSRRIYGFQKYLTISNHGFLGYAVLINEKFWNSLPDKVKPKIQEAMNETTNWMISQSQKMNDDQLKWIEKESSIQIHYLSDKDKMEWYPKFKPVYHKFLQSVHSKELKKFAEERMEQMETQ